VSNSPSSQVLLYLWDVKLDFLFFSTLYNVSKSQMMSSLMSGVMFSNRVTFSEGLLVAIAESKVNLLSNIP